ncbi:hypothetical protein [Viridibacterium curvum]|uniref:Lipoprotein n=1 Tax=Viridibacterium curvum TaxID=1101404 RepID=A0ABP9QB86_9RHOO
MIRSALLFLALAVVTASCASRGSRQPKYDIETDDLKQAPTNELCETYGMRQIRVAEIRAEMLRRQLFTPEELNKVDRRSVEVGMSECALLAAFPSEDADIDEPRSRPGSPVIKSYTFQCLAFRLPYCPATVYEVRDGKIVAIFKEN